MRKSFPVVAMKMIVHGTGYHHPFLLGQSFDATR
jgi:hypothetical protein